MPGLHGNLDARLGAAARWALLHGPPELKIHVAAGLAIGAGAISLAVLSLRARQRPWRLFARLGLFTSVPAGLVGARIPRLPPRRPVLPADVDRLPRRPLLLRDRPVPHPLNENRATRHREQRPTPGLLIPAAGEQTARRGNARHVIKLPARRPNSTLVYSACTPGLHRTVFLLYREVSH